MHFNFVGQGLKLVHVAFMAGKAHVPISIAGYDMEVDVHDRLSGGLAVVLEDVESVAGECVLEMGGDFLYASDESAERFFGSVEQPDAVAFGNYKGVSLGKRVDVQVGKDKFVLVYFEGRNFAGGYGAEYAIVFHAADYSISVGAAKRCVGLFCAIIPA